VPAEADTPPPFLPEPQTNQQERLRGSLSESSILELL